jgi:hypothetical protein
MPSSILSNTKLALVTARAWWLAPGGIQQRRAGTSRDLARADLDLASEQVSIDQAQISEGRPPAAKAEQDRAVENEKWLALYEAQTTAERARLNILRQTGALIAALQ